MAHKATQQSKSTKPQNDIIQLEEVVDAIITLQAIAKEEGSDTVKMPGLHLLKDHIGHGSLPRIKKLRELYEQKIADEKAHPIPDPVNEALQKTVKSLWRSISNEMDQVLEADHQARETAENALKTVQQQLDDAVRESLALNRANMGLQEDLDEEKKAHSDLKKEKEHLQERLDQQERFVKARHEQLVSEQLNHKNTRDQFTTEVKALEHNILEMENRHAEQMRQSEILANDMKTQLKAENATAQRRIEELTVEKNNAHTVATALTGDKEELIISTASLKAILTTTQKRLDTEIEIRKQAEEKVVDYRLLKVEAKRLKEHNETLAEQLKQLQSDYRSLTLSHVKPTKN